MSAPERLTHRERPAVADPEGALVLLHGRGADEHDLYPLLDVLDPDRRLVGATARGPHALPPTTFLPTYERLAGWLDGFLDHNAIEPSRLVLGGFSQGTVMSYSLAFGSGRPRPAGVLALSGFMPTVEGFPLDLDRAAGLPVAIGHGSHDPVISVDFARSARERLEAAGADITYQETPMAHQIDPRFLGSMPAWVRTTLR